MRRLVDAWIVNARAIADSAVAAIGARREDFFILYNGIEPEAFVSALTPAEAKRRIGLDPGCPVVAKMARLHPQKNHPMFLRMAAAVLQRRPDARFLIVGDGPLRAALEEQARSMGLAGAVLFLGLRGDVPDLLAATDVSVLTSDFEGLANALLEAMSVGLPVVTTDYPGVEEIITDRQEGFVVPREDAQTMAEAICRLLDRDDLRREMGQCGVRTVKTRFSMEAMASNLFSIYRTCLERKGRSAP
jgi:glycosyltransferase involved in cell wall biosynthesis